MPHLMISVLDVTVINLIGQDAWDKAHKAAKDFSPDERSQQNYLAGYLGAEVEIALRNPR